MRIEHRIAAAVLALWPVWVPVAGQSAPPAATSLSELSYVEMMLNDKKVRITLAQADWMRAEVVDRLAAWPKPEAVELRSELTSAVPWIDRGGQLHFGRWSLMGGGSVITLTAAYPQQAGLPLGLWNPGLWATFERRAGGWHLIDVTEASTTR